MHCNLNLANIWWIKYEDARDEELEQVNQIIYVTIWSKISVFASVSSLTNSVNFFVCWWCGEKWSSSCDLNIVHFQSANSKKFIQPWYSVHPFIYRSAFRAFLSFQMRWANMFCKVFFLFSSFMYRDEKVIFTQLYSFTRFSISKLSNASFSADFMCSLNSSSSLSPFLILILSHIVPTAIELIILWQKKGQTTKDLYKQAERRKHPPMIVHSSNINFADC